MLVDDECTLIMPGREAEMKQPAHGISLLAQDAVVVHGASVICCIGTVASLGWSQGVFVTFVVFEMVCGVFFPVFGSLRAVYVPEKQRSTIMNFFRVPLNLFVVVVLIKKKDMTNEATFLVCAAAHLLSLGIWFAFATLNVQKGGSKGAYRPVDTEKERATPTSADEEEDFGRVEDGDSEFKS